MAKKKKVPKQRRRFIGDGMHEFVFKIKPKAKK